MKLSDSGESRVRGYLFVFERSLRTFLPRDIASSFLATLGLFTGYAIGAAFVVVAAPLTRGLQ